MYAYIKGKISEINPTNIVIDNNGIGYEITVANPYEYQLNEEKQIYISQQVREDSNTLYGFLTKEQKKVFLLLLKVKGVGPKSALAILAGATSEEIISAIEKQDVNYLTKFPGVGKKTAQQIILDLKGKFEAVPEETTKAVVSTNQATLEEAKEALLGLGYSAKEITKIWKSLEAAAPSTTQEALKVAFKLLMK